MAPTPLDALPFPRSATAAAALEVATAYHSPALLNHSLRAYVWAAARGTAEGIAFDPELLYVAALFHDLGLVPAFDSHTVAFEEAGGHLARVFAAGAGWPAERRTRLSDVIVRHMWPRVEVSDDPEGHLLSRATATEIVGKGADEHPPAFRAEVLARYPRLDLTAQFLACFQDQAARKPDSSAARAVGAGLAQKMAADPQAADTGAPPPPAPGRAPAGHG
ncbi:HD domain-containing protein [Actinacidiphila paucisporea]|uniref:HD domain-containing protein n=1 Tax=Actinacidiphila paucisporea TaxID=310782 RepID=A0A1M7NYY5_9ACTN|nr:HD domain-containing protein [Actinacidiphila paucisporea]SHN09363.1 HD domain-containing protein [Actinacidiphila paucisporea]